MDKSAEAGASRPASKYDKNMAALLRSLLPSQSDPRSRSSTTAKRVKLTNHTEHTNAPTQSVSYEAKSSVTPCFICSQSFQEFLSYAQEELESERLADAIDGDVESKSSNSSSSTILAQDSSPKSMPAAGSSSQRHIDRHAHLIRSTQAEFELKAASEANWIFFYTQEAAFAYADAYNEVVTNKKQMLTLPIPLRYNASRLDIVRSKPSSQLAEEIFSDVPLPSLRPLHAPGGWSPELLASGDVHLQPVRVFGYDKPGEGGKRLYLVAQFDEFLKRYVILPKRLRVYYELIRSHVPCRTYFDIECKVPSISVRKQELELICGGQQRGIVTISDGIEAVRTFLQRLAIHFRLMIPELSDIRLGDVVDMNASRPPSVYENGKFSRHIIIRLYLAKDDHVAGREATATDGHQECVWSHNGILKLFILEFCERIRKEIFGESSGSGLALDDLLDHYISRYDTVESKEPIPFFYIEQSMLKATYTPNEQSVRARREALTQIRNSLCTTHRSQIMISQDKLRQLALPSASLSGTGSCRIPLLVDESVYSKNRLFRILLSVKRNARDYPLEPRMVTHPQQIRMTAWKAAEKLAQRIVLQESSRARVIRVALASILVEGFETARDAEDDISFGYELLKPVVARGNVRGDTSRSSGPALTLARTGLESNCIQAIHTAMQDSRPLLSLISSGFQRSCDNIMYLNRLRVVEDLCSRSAASLHQLCAISQSLRERSQEITKFADILRQRTFPSPYLVLDVLLMDFLRWERNNNLFAGCNVAIEFCEWRISVRTGVQTIDAVSPSREPTVHSDLRAKICYIVKGAFCLIAGRVHKSNQTIQMIDLDTGILSQSCFDIECQQNAKSLARLPSANLFGYINMLGSNKELGESPQNAGDLKNYEDALTSLIRRITSLWRGTCRPVPAENPAATSTDETGQEGFEFTLTEQSIDSIFDLLGGKATNNED